MTTRALPHIGLLAWFVTIGLVPTVATRTPEPPLASPNAAVRVPANARDQASAGAATPSPQHAECLMRHGEADAKAESGRSIAVDATRFAGPVHGARGLSCTACHTDLVGVALPHPAMLDSARPHPARGSGRWTPPSAPWVSPQAT